MANPGYHVEGLSRVVRQLQAVGLEVEDLKAAFSEIAALGARVASSYAPRRSGALAADVRGNRAKNKASVIAGRARVRYAGVQNYGWAARGIQPSHFMQRADAALRPRVVPLLEANINQIIRAKGLK